MYPITRRASTRRVPQHVDRPPSCSASKVVARRRRVPARLLPDDSRTCVALARAPTNHQEILRAALLATRKRRWGHIGACALCASCCARPAARIPPSESKSAESAGPALPARPDPLSTDALLGKVFGSVEEFVETHHADDADQISTQQVAGSSFVWLVDRTAQTNGTWRLFERLEGGGARYLLCHSSGSPRVACVSVPP